MTKLLTPIFLLFFSFTISCQISYDLEKLHEFSKRDDFIVHKVTKNKILDNFAETANYRFKGSVGEKDFSFNIITYLESGKFLEVPIEINFEIDNFTPEIFKELLVWKAVAMKYPDSSIDYLLERAKKQFRNDWNDEISNFGFDLGVLELAMGDNEVITNVFQYFSESSKKRENIAFLNEEELVTGMAVYVQYIDELLDFSLRANLEKDFCCSIDICRLLCLNEKLNVNQWEEITDGIAGFFCLRLVEAWSKSGNAYAGALAVASCSPLLVRVLTECNNDCRVDPCAYTQTDDLFPGELFEFDIQPICNVGKLCLPVEYELFPYTIFGPVEPSGIVEKDNLCIDCPVILNFDQNFSWEFDEYMDGALSPIDGESGTWRPISPDPDDPNSIVNLPWKVLLCYNEICVELDEVSRGDEPTSINQLLLLSELTQVLAPVVKKGDELCIKLESPSTLDPNMNCNNEECIDFICPFISVSREHGLLGIEVENLNTLLWSVYSEEPNFSKTPAFTLDIKKKVGNEFIVIGTETITKNGRIEFPINSPGTYCVEFGENCDNGSLFFDLGCLEDFHEIRIFEECLIQDPISVSSHELLFDNFITKRLLLNFNNVNGYPFSLRVPGDNEYIIECEDNQCEISNITSFIAGSICFVVDYGGGCVLNDCVQFGICDGPAPPPIVGVDPLDRSSNACINYSVLASNPSGPNADDGTIEISFAKDDYTYLVEWITTQEPNGGQATDSYLKEELTAGEACFMIYVDKNGECCEVYDCITLTAECPEIILPEFEYFTNNCSGYNIIIQHDSNDHPSGGEPPYTWEWNAENLITNGNGNRFEFDDFPDAHGLLKDGVFRLTVTDANGCSTIQNFSNPEPPDMPILLDVEVAEHSCKNPRELRFVIDYIIPENNNPNVEYGYSWRTFTPGVIESALYTGDPINTTGLGQIEIAIDAEGPLREAIEIKLYKGPSVAGGCETSNSFIFEVPEFPSNTNGSSLNIVKISDEECDLNNVTYMLVGECTSEYGCNIIGDVQHVNGERVPQGHFNIDLGFIFGPRSFTLNPLLSDGSICGPVNAMMYADHDNSVLVLGDDVWKVGFGCNCWNFTINSNQGINPANYSIVPPDNDQIEYFNVEIRNDYIEATICIEESGIYCIDVVDQYGCVTQHCKQLDIKELESTTTIFDDATCSPGPDGSLTVNVNGGVPPYKFTYHDGLEEYLVYEGHAFVVFDNMPPGNYKFSFTDARGCSGGQDIVTVDECVSNQNYTDFDVHHNLESNEFYVLGIDVDYARPPEESVEISWTGPNGFTESGPIISPTASGLYCFSAKPCCGGPFTGCRAFLNPIDCPFDQLPMSVENSCASNNLLNPKRIGIDPQPFAWALGELLPLDVKNVRVEIILQSENEGGTPVERTIFDETTVRNDYSDRLHFVNTTQGSTLGPGSNQYNLEPSERDNLTVLVRVSIEGVELCVNTTPVTFEIEECDWCYPILSNEADHLTNSDLQIYGPVGDAYYFETEGAIPTYACECFESCSNLVDLDPGECTSGHLNLKFVDANPNDPCPYSPEMELWCGDKKISGTFTGEVFPLEVPFTDVPLYPYGPGDVRVDPLDDTKCIYKYGCVYIFEYEEPGTGNIIVMDILIPSEISRPCPTDPSCSYIVGNGEYDLCIQSSGDGYYTANLPNFCPDPLPELDEECQTFDDCENLTFRVYDAQATFSGSHGTVYSADARVECIYEIGCDDNGFRPYNPPILATDLVGIFVNPNNPWTEGELFPPHANSCIHEKSDGSVAFYVNCSSNCHTLVAVSSNYSFSHLSSLYNVCDPKYLPDSEGDGDCIPNVVGDPENPPIIEIVDPNFPPGAEPKSVVYSEQYDGPVPSEGERDFDTYIYSGFGTEGENSQNYFYMQSNHVSCNPAGQFDHCGQNSVYWTTKLDVNGEGVICGTSNMFWRSGWCACPSQANISFGVGWYKGQIEDQYTQTVNQSTRYMRNTKGGHKSSLSKDVVLLGVDATGALQTTETYGGPGDDAATSITTITPVDGNLATSSGGFAMTGYFDSGIDFSGDGSDKLSANGTDAFVALFSSDGSYINSINNIVEGYDVRGKAISSDSKGNFILVLSVKESAKDQIGHTEIVKLSSTLDIIWEIPITGGVHSIDPGNVMIYNNDNIIVAGSFEENIQIGNKQKTIDSNKHGSFITRITKSGVPSWIRVVGISNEPIVTSAISEAPSNEFYLTGHFTDDIIVNNNTVEVGTETTSFIAKYQRNGVLKEIHSLGSEAFFQVNDMSSDRKGGLGLVGKYAGDINIGGFDLPNDNSEERGFFIPLAELFADNKSIFQDISVTSNYQQEFIQEETSVSIYPNPFKNFLNIEYFSEHAGEIKLEVYYLSGQLILQKKVEVDVGINKIKLEEGLQDVNGVLQLKTTATDGSVFIDKVIKLQ